MNSFVLTFYILQVVNPATRCCGSVHVYPPLHWQGELRITCVSIGRRQVEFAEGWREGRIWSGGVFVRVRDKRGWRRDKKWDQWEERKR